MAELTTDAQALSEAATSFDGIRYFFLFDDSAEEPRVGMQDTEKAVGGMFSAPADSSEAATSFDRISSDLKGAIGQVDSTAGDLAGALSGPAGDAASMADTEKGITGLLDEGGQCVQKLAGIWGGSGSDAYQQTQQRWDSTAQELNTISENINRSGVQYQQAADDAASTLSSSMGFTPPDDGFDFKAMESGEAAGAGCTGDACNGGAAGILFGDGGDGAHFDGKLLTAHDLIREQASVFDAGFDLI